jgi:hypothetical protein
MKFVERKDLDEKIWSTWCSQSPELGPFCQLEYLDAVADNLVFLIEEGKGGIALPYKTRLGVKTVYTPVFCRWIGFVGKQPRTTEKQVEAISMELKQADVYAFKDLRNEQKETLIYQTVNGQQYALNTQAKRKLKKGAKENWKISWDNSAEEAIDVIESSLKNKFKTLEDSSFPKLRQLAFNFKKTDQLKVISLLDAEQKIIGALLLIVSGDKILYLKGACKETTKMNGGMYYLMNEAIQNALVSGKTFDFGGSRISGVRKFNLSFGAVDQHYFHVKWNKGPSWYSLIKKIRNKIKNG